ncbi:MAG: dUTP diphosphatase [Patescibacteria group bacterium]
MNGFPGKFIVIDGTDGSGKTTQLNLLKNRLEAAGHVVAVADFPQYNTKSAGIIEEYLSGKYGRADEISAYKASIFYAIDRYDASFQIRKWLTEGKIVLANRYTSANMGHQGCKIENPLERRVFFNWLYDLEYKIFEIPRPDLSIILQVDSTIAQSLAKERAREDWIGKTNDIHEDNLEHLKKAEQVYLEIANSFPNFQLISCTKNNELLNREEISLLVWLTVKRIISHPDEPTTNFQAISHIIGANQQIVNHREIIFDHYKNTQKINRPEIDNEELNDQANRKLNDQAIVITPHKKSNPHKLLVEKINPHAKLPQKAHASDAAYDLYANDYYSIPPYGQSLVSTGLKMAIPAGLVGLIWDKSGLANAGITTMGGVIDAGYRGEIKVVVKNLSEDVFNIVPQQKIAQILIQAITDLEISEEKITDSTDRQADNFGSTGHF